MIMNTKTNLTIKQGKSVGPQVYRIIHDQIVHGDIAPGTRLSESEISRLLSVSRQPVREAFIKLRNEGLVDVRPQRGTYVSKILIDAVNDARFIREAIEADVVKLLVEISNPELVAELRCMIQSQRDLDKSELSQFLELDEQFHRSLAELAGKSTVWKVVASMKAHFDRVRYLSTTQKPLQRLIDQHEAVVEAIAKKDMVKAEEAIRHHLREVLRDLPKVVSMQPGIFEGQSTDQNVDLGKSE